MENQKKTTNSLARRMGISLICGLAAGLLLMMLRENLNSSGQHDIRMNCFPSSFSKYLVFKNLIPVPKTPLGSY